MQAKLEPCRTFIATVTDGFAAGHKLKTGVRRIQYVSGCLLPGSGRQNKYTRLFVDSGFAQVFLPQLPRCVSRPRGSGMIRDWMTDAGTASLTGRRHAMNERTDRQSDE